MSVQSRHSARIVSITRSAWALAFGAWIEVRMTRIPSARSSVSNDRLNLVSRSRMRNRMAGEWPSRSITRFRACSGDPGRVRVRRYGTQVDPPAPELDEHEDVERPEPGGLHGEEVAGDDPLRLSPQELGPGWAGPSWGGTEARGPEQGADRRRPDPDPELAEFALDPDAAPTGVLPGQPEDERADGGIDRWPAWATGPAIGPLPPHELAVPPKEGRRGDKEGDPAVTRQDATP